MGRGGCSVQFMHQCINQLGLESSADREDELDPLLSEGTEYEYSYETTRMYEYPTLHGCIALLFLLSLCGYYGYDTIDSSYKSTSIQA